MECTSPDHLRRNSTVSRRQYLLGSGLLAIGSTAGCLGDSSDSDERSSDTSPWERSIDGEPITWDELGDLHGDLTVYSGRTRDQIAPIFDELEETYPDLTIHRDFDNNDTQVNKIIEEGDASPADIFYTQDSGALAVVKREGLFADLPADIAEGVQTDRTDPDGKWMGVSGRVRAILYNTDIWEGGAAELPSSILEYAYDERFQGRISTRPNSGSFRAFIVAMIELEGEEATRDWVRTLVTEQDITLYSGGTQQAQAVNDGEVDVGLGNQYYAARILNEDPDASIDVAFTENDAGCLFNVSGIGIPASTNNASLAAEFARHLIAVEGQEFFIDVNGEYPVMDGIEYVGDLPNIDEINPPAFDLNQLGLELTTASDLLREEDMVV